MMIATMIIITTGAAKKIITYHENKISSQYSVITFKEAYIS